MIQRIIDYFSIEKLSALITWGVISGSALYYMVQSGTSTVKLSLACACFVIFLVSFFAAIRLRPYEHENLSRGILMVVQFIAIIAVFFLVPYTYTAILVTIWGGQLPHFMKFRTAILTSPLWSSPLFLVHTLYWEREFMFINALLFWTFNLFALVMMNATLEAQRAREAANELNRDLMATQALLNQATKQAERIRIARNIHDLLGHHLTALTINLQVASRISDGEAKGKIDECHGLAKLLLSDVREAVSEIREKSNLQLDLAIQALVENVPQIKVQMDYEAGLHITDVTVAEAILRCVQESLTNSLRHSQADQFEIKLWERDNHLQMTLKDNGAGQGDPRPGNGMKGMQERIAEVGGTIRFERASSGFLTTVEFPEYV